MKKCRFQKRKLVIEFLGLILDIILLSIQLKKGFSNCSIFGPTLSQYFYLLNITGIVNQPCGCAACDVILLKRKSPLALPYKCIRGGFQIYVTVVLINHFLFLVFHDHLLLSHLGFLISFFIPFVYYNEQVSFPENPDLFF